MTVNSTTSSEGAGNILLGSQSLALPSVLIGNDFVVAVTREVFACDPEFEVMSDPEDPSCEFVAATVHCQGEPWELLQKRLEWHRRIRRGSHGLSQSLRLSVIPRLCNQTNS